MGDMECHESSGSSEEMNTRRLSRSYESNGEMDAMVFYEVV